MESGSGPGTFMNLLFVSSNYSFGCEGSARLLKVWPGLVKKASCDGPMAVLHLNKLEQHQFKTWSGPQLVCSNFPVWEGGRHGVHQQHVAPRLHMLHYSCGGFHAFVQLCCHTLRTGLSFSSAQASVERHVGEVFAYAPLCRAGLKSWTWPLPLPTDVPRSGSEEGARFSHQTPGPCSQGPMVWEA